MRSLWLIYELGIPFQLVEMPFDLRHTRSPQYLAIHPLGRVPCLTDGEFKLFESGAIAEYLCERFPAAGLGRLSGDSERYDWLQWIYYSETIAVHAAAVVQQHFFIKAADRSAAVLKLEGLRLAKSLDVVEERLRDREYLLQTGFSAADIAVGYSIHLSLRFIVMANFPTIDAYYKRLSEREAFRKSLPSGWQRPLTWLPETLS